MRTLPEIGNDIRTQDNRITALPIFCVQQKRRHYGIDLQWGGEVVWLMDGEEGSELEQKGLESDYEKTGAEPEQWTRTGFIDIWEFVTACFTENGANDYISENGHNLKEPRIYVESGYRNDEWKTVREHLMSL